MKLPAPKTSTPVRPVLVLMWLVASIASLILMVTLRHIDGFLKSTSTPAGIVGFELAFTRERAAFILQTWTANGALTSARESLRLDFAFLLAYPVSLALGCRILARRNAGWFDRVGIQLSYALFACIPLDATENVALLRMLDIGASNGLARLAAICATIKFALILGAVVFLIAAQLRGVFGGAFRGAR